MPLKTLERCVKPHLQFVPESKVAIVFSCPGRHEKKERRPAAGTTGKNLDKLLAFLRDSQADRNFERSRMIITNAWSKVEYEELTKRSEAKNAQIAIEANLSRLKNELGNAKLVIASGKKAQTALAALHGQLGPVKILGVPHLGGRGLLSMTDVKAAKGRTITDARLYALARWLADRRNTPGNHIYPQ